MLYIGWDIGIKNLAYCIIEYKNGKQTIREFDIINLIEDLAPVTNKCSLTHKNGNKCSSKALYKLDNLDNITYYCNKHYNSDIKNKTIKEKKKFKKIKEKKLNANKISLETLGKKLFEKLENNKLFLECNYIIIENQPVLKNPKMKSIQIMLYSYFLIKNKNIEAIQLVNASNKLKVFKGKLDESTDIKLKKINDKYKRNKLTAIAHCDKMIEELEELEELDISNNSGFFLDYFRKHKKQDDLADAYLMCRYFINKINK